MVVTTALAISAIGGLVLGLLGLGANAYTNHKNQKLIESQNAFNANQAQIARDWNEQQYMKFQTPAQQVKMYKEAGLNPALMYGMGPSISTMPSSPVATASGSIPSQSPDLSAFNDIIGNYLNIKSTDADVANKEADTLNKKATYEQIQENTKNLKETRSQIIEAVNSAKLDNELKEKTIYWYDVIQGSQLQLTEMQRVALKVSKDKTQAEKVYLEQVQTKIGLSQKQLNDAQTAVDMATIRKISADIEYLGKQGKVADATADVQKDIHDRSEYITNNLKEQTNNLVVNKNFTQKQADWYVANLVWNNLNNSANSISNVVKIFKPL